MYREYSNEGRGVWVEMETLQSRLDFITNSTTAERLNITYVLMDRAMHCPLNNPLRTFPKETLIC